MLNWVWFEGDIRKYIYSIRINITLTVRGKIADHMCMLFIRNSCRTRVSTNANLCYTKPTRTGLFVHKPQYEPLLTLVFG